MELIKTKGLVLRSVNFGDYDKMLTVLCEGYGKISIVAKGAKSLKHGGIAWSNTFSYSELVLYPKKDVYVFSQGTNIENFFGLSENLETLDCAAEILEFVNFISFENQACDEILRLTLNALFGLSKLHKPVMFVKIAFYLKALVFLGFESELYNCGACDASDELSFFSPAYGGVICTNCRKNVSDSLVISEDSLNLMRFINGCDLKDFLKFNIPNHSVNEIYKIIVLFITEHLDFDIKKVTKKGWL